MVLVTGGSEGAWWDGGRSWAGNGVQPERDRSTDLARLVHVRSSGSGVWSGGKAEVEGYDGGGKGATWGSAHRALRRATATFKASAGVTG